MRARIVPFLFLLAACDREAPPPATPIAAGTTEPAPVATSPSRPADAPSVMPIADSPPSEPVAEMPLDMPYRMRKDTTYRVRGTTLVVRSDGAQMVHRNDGKNDMYWVAVPIQVWFEGEHATLTVNNGVPTKWHGYQFVASEYQFSKGDTDAYVSVRRLPE
jgi:hypothetical protein